MISKNQNWVSLLRITYSQGQTSGRKKMMFEGKSEMLGEMRWGKISKFVFVN